MEDTNPEMVASPLGQVTGKSKLDTLSKEDLIKFAKKQMVVMQKMKSKCSDLEKEVEALKVPADDTVIQELNERLNAVLLEKAETHQSLTSLHKEHEELKSQAQEMKERLTSLHEELQIKNKEHADLQSHTAELTANFQTTCNQYESKISQFEKELAEAKQQLTAEIEALKDSHQTSLTQSHQEIENLQLEMERLTKQYEDDVRDLEEHLELNTADFENERKRLLSLQGELSEQLALKEGFLQDVQEEEEDGGKAIQKDSEIPKVLDFPASDDSSNEAAALKLALEDSRSQNVMLQEELIFLTNVKLELESELKQARDEFTVEKEELEFRINELQMNRDDGETSLDKTGKRRRSSAEQHHQKVKTLQESHDEDLKESNLTSAAEGEPQEEIHHGKSLSISPNNIPTNLEDEAELFIKRYQMKEGQTEASVRALQEKLKSVFQERDDLLEKLKNAEGTSELAMDRLNMSFEDLRMENEEILSLLQHKENLVLEFKEMLKFTDLPHGKSNVAHEDDEPRVQVNDLENQLLIVTSEKEQQIKTLEEDVCALHSKEKEHEETIRHLKSQVSCLSEERDGLQRNTDISQQQLSEARRHIAEIIRQNSSEAEVDEASDILTLINRLLTIKILEEDVCALRSKEEEHEETIRLLKSQVSCLSEERDGLQRNTDISQQQLSEARRHIAEILRQNSSEAEVDEASDILTLINRLLTIKILEEDVCALRSKDEEHEETIRLLKSQVSCLSEERDALQKNTDISQQQLSEARRHIAEIIRQNSSEAEVDEASDILTLINRLLTIKILEEDVCALRSKEEEHEETIRLLKSQVSCLSEERDGLQRNTDISQQQLSEARRHIAEILRQNSSEAEVDEASDILTLINRLLTIKILEEDVCALRSKDEEHEETIRLLKSQVSCLSEERDALQKNTDISQQQLSEARRHIAEIIRQNSSEAEVDEASDILTLINRLLTIKILEEDVCALRSKEEEHEETIRLLKSQVSCLSEERDALQKNTDISQQQLSEARRHIAEILRQNSSEAEVDEALDILTLINHLLTKVQEEKSILTQDFDERAERFTLELESTRRSAEEQTSELQEHLKDVSREKDMLKASLDDMVLDTEGLQKDLSEIQAMNEKLKAENLTLLTQVDDLSRSLEDKRHEEDQSEESEIQVSLTTELQQSLADKDALISQLREEIGHLQMYKQTSVSDEDMKVLSHKIEIMEKEIKEKDERMNKIKAVAVKAKKELDNSKKEVVALSEEVGMLKDERDKLSRSMKDIIHGAEDYKNVMVEYDKQTELLDKEKEKLEQAEKHNEDLTRRLQNVTHQHELLSSEREDLMVRLETLQNNVTQLESRILELQKLNVGLEKQLEAERLVKEQKAKEHQSAVKDMEELHAQLSKLKHQLQQTTQELEQLRKDAQQNTLLDMEMADYEKLVKELNHKLCERDQQIEEHETKEKMQKEQEQRLNEEMESLKVLLDQSEEKASKMKQLLVKTKKELGDAKQKEASQMITQSSLRGELEAHQQQLEEYKIQCSNLTADRHRLEEQLKMMNDQQQRTSSSYQLRLNGLQDECTAAKAELAATVSEFESYKVRVHNVLKQQKHKGSNQSNGDAFQHERKQMDAVMEQLRSRLQETQQTLQSSTSELQQLQTEHDTLLERHNKILQESVSKEAELRERVLTLQSENVSLKSEHGQCASHLSAQTEALRSSFREQVRHLQDEHCSTVETLQQQITRLETQLFHMQKEQSCSGPALVQSRKCPVERKLTDVPQFDLQGLAREEGEGMETTETECVSSPGTPLASLEQLLIAPDPKREPVVWQVEPSKEELTQKLNTTARSVEHLNGLLHETEATNAVLMEQITLLKSEVRRLERNHEREKSVANLEYLKNVLLQFIFLRSGSERQALLPVIHTMLQLSPDEKNKLAAIAQGEEESAGSRASGWTSYLHSWSGIR